VVTSTSWDTRFSRKFLPDSRRTPVAVFQLLSVFTATIQQLLDNIAIPVNTERVEKRRQESVANSGKNLREKRVSPARGCDHQGKTTQPNLEQRCDGWSALRLNQMLTLCRVTTKGEADIATFELPIRYDALTISARSGCYAMLTKRKGRE